MAAQSVSHDSRPAYYLWVVANSRFDTGRLSTARAERQQQLVADQEHELCAEQTALRVESDGSAQELT